MFTSHSNCRSTQITFYVFEVCALIIAVVYAILTLYTWIYSTCLYGASWSIFFSGLSCIAEGIFNTLVVFGIGKIIDCLPKKSCCRKDDDQDVEENEEE